MPDRVQRNVNVSAASQSEAETSALAKRAPYSPTVVSTLDRGNGKYRVTVEEDHRIGLLEEVTRAVILKSKVRHTLRIQAAEDDLEREAADDQHADTVADANAETVLTDQQTRLAGIKTTPPWV